MASPVNWWKGIHDLAYTGGRVNGALGAGYNEDWVGLGVNVGAGLGKTLWYAREKFDFLDKAKLDAPGPTPTPTYIVDRAMLLITFIDFMNGVSDPTEGETFNTGKLAFEFADSKLEGAAPDKQKWDGDAADAYAAQNAALRALAQKMQQLDQQMPALLQKQAESVRDAHKCCQYALMLLVLAQGIALILWCHPAAGPVASVNFQKATVAAITPAVIWFEMAAHYGAIAVGEKMDALTAAYKVVAEKAKLAGTSAQTASSAAVGSSVSGFEAISASMSGMAGFTEMPTVASLFSAAGERAPADQRALLSALVGDGETPWDQTSVETTAQTTPQTTAWIPPTPPRPTAMSSPAPRPSARRAAAAPAEETAPAGNVEEPGVAMGAGTGERAPIEVAAQPPRPAERVA